MRIHKNVFQLQFLDDSRAVFTVQKAKGVPIKGLDGVVVENGAVGGNIGKFTGLEKVV